MGVILIQTSRFGQVEVDESLVLHFEQPILGFDDQKDFVILDHAEDSPFKWLQSVTIPELAFVITNPKLFGIDYEFAIPDDVSQKLSVQSAEDVLVVTIVNIPNDDPRAMTTNLLGPIIINENTKHALQVVLNDSKFSTKMRLVPDETAENDSASRQPSAAGQKAGE